MVENDHLGVINCIELIREMIIMIYDNLEPIEKEFINHLLDTDREIFKFNKLLQKTTVTRSIYLPKFFNSNVNRALTLLGIPDNESAEIKNSSDQVEYIRCKLLDKWSDCLIGTDPLTNIEYINYALQTYQIKCD